MGQRGLKWKVGDVVTDPGPEVQRHQDDVHGLDISIGLLACFQQQDI